MTTQELLVRLGDIIQKTEEERDRQTSATGKAYLNGYIAALDRIVGILMEQRTKS